MPRLAFQINRRPRRKFIVAASIVSFAVWVILSGTPMLESPLHGQYLESLLPFRFSSYPVIKGRSPSAVRLSKGKFLVASRQLKDPNFTETVVLLVEYDRFGAVGLVINRPSEMRLSTVLPDMEGLQGMPDTVYVGGPVAKNQMLLLIRSGSQPDGARRVVDDIYLSSSRALLRKMVEDKAPGQTFRLYAGHAGWAPGQLDQEVARGGWHVLEADGATVFEKAPSEIWPDLIQRSSALWVRLKMGGRGKPEPIPEVRGITPPPFAGNKEYTMRASTAVLMKRIGSSEYRATLRSGFNRRQISGIVSQVAASASLTFEDQLKRTMNRIFLKSKEEGKMTTRQVILSAFLAALLSVPSIALAVEFGPNSASITHRYLPVEIGTWHMELGAGNWTGRVVYTHAVGIDIISGAQIGAQTFNDVKCLKVNLIHTELSGADELSTIWLAQDTMGNVWLLKAYSPIDGTTYTLGSVFTSWLMPAVPAIGERAGVTIPETQSDYCEIMAVGIPVDTHYGSYSDCIKVICFHQSDADEVEYYCPDLGNVRMSNVANPPDVLDLKEHGTATVTQTTTVVIPLMD